jgi:hypothetical protein
MVLLLCAASALAAGSPVYVVLWFDTEDYIEASADNAALRIANDLTVLGVRATFKVVGEKARVLESRGRKDVIAALKQHDIGYHSNWHSVHPTPAEYLVRMGFVEGADEFERREAAGLADVKRVFGIEPSCYGQPGNSWGPQTNAALRRMNVLVYLDEGDQVGLGEQPFWYDGLLYVFHMGKNQFRAQLNVGNEDREAYQRFDEAATRLSAAGGGVISIYYHPTEFVTTEFWDGVNFRHGANPERADWAKPKLRTREDSERTYGVLRSFVQHMKQQPDVRFVTARELLDMYTGPAAGPVDRRAAAERLRRGIGFADVGGQTFSAAELLMAALGIPIRVVDGPTGAGKTTYAKATVPAAAFSRTRAEAVAFIERFGRLPNEVFVGPDTLSLIDFAATVAAAGESEVTVVRGKTAFDGQFATDGKRSFNWVIHPEGFDGSALLELGRLQGWTLKPARMKK